MEKSGILNKRKHEVNRLVIDDEEAEIVRMMFDLCVSSGYGKFRLAHFLNDHGIRNRKKLNMIVRYYLESVGLWEEVKDRLHTPAARMSIGQQQRLCLARGLAVEPQFILADEATSALDPISSKTIEDLFLKLREEYAVVLVTHTLRQARRIADYVIFMYMGEIIEAGPAEQIFNNPQQELTQKYLEGVFS